MSRQLPLVLLFVLAFTTLGRDAAAQSLGSFTWQLQPFCNRVTVSVRQDGAIYTLDGTDDRCGAQQKAPLVGVAAPNLDGSIGFGLNIVAPSGQAAPVQARISVATLSGTWSDSAGNSGAFVFGGAAAGLPPRPGATAAGDITAVTAGTGLTGGGPAGDVSLAVDSSVVQSRVTTACPAGQALRAINQNGSATCEAITGSAGGDITAVNVGVGLTGGGTSGDVSLGVAFGGSGAQNLAARSDHTHALANNNTAVGAAALDSVTTGTNSVAAGTNALTSNASGAFNVAVGANALAASVAGGSNTAVGNNTLASSTASNNTALGAAALFQNTTGSGNVGLGVGALNANTTGFENTGIGDFAGLGHVTGSFNTFLGAGSGGTGALANATAIGSRALVEQNNSLVLGSIQNVNGAFADTRVGVGTSAPGAAVDVDGQDAIPSLRLTRFTAGLAEGVRVQARSARGTRAAPAPLLAGDNLLFVIAQGFDGNQFTLTDRAFLVAEATENWAPTATGTRWNFATTPNGATARVERLVIDHDGEVGIGTADPQSTLHVAGTIRADTLGTAGATGLCRNASNQISTCSSSLRYKTDVTSFTSGLGLVDRLQPIAFAWKDDGLRDVGFAAEAVASVDSRLVTYDRAGQVEGVKYDRLTTALVNAVKELKERNDALERRLAALEGLLAAKP